MNNIKAARYAPIPSMYTKTLSDLIRVMLKVDPKGRPTAYQLATCEALSDDLQFQLNFYKTLPVSSSSSGASSDSAEGGTRNSISSAMSGEATTSGVYSGEIRPQDWKNFNWCVSLFFVFKKHYELLFIHAEFLYRWFNEINDILIYLTRVWWWGI